MLKKAEWPAINLSRDDYERLIWWALFDGPTHGWEGCHGRLSQLMVDFIVGRKSPARERLQRQNIYPFHPPMILLNLAVIYAACRDYPVY
jgi:hypothetical protein